MRISRRDQANQTRPTVPLSSSPPNWWDSWLVEILFTVVAGFTGLYISTLSLAHETKVPLEMMLGFIEISFVSFRLFDRRLNDVTSQLHSNFDRTFRSAVQYIPQDRLSIVSERWLSRKRDGLLQYAYALEENHAIELKREGAYREVIELTDAVTEAGLGDIVAISSNHIVDFAEEPLAQAYFEANRRARARQVTVNRLFIIAPGDINDRFIRTIIERHAVELKLSDGNEGVKWMLKTDAGRHQSEDFALFASKTVVRQLLSGDFELNEVDTVVRERRQIFDQLWDSPSAKTVDDLVNFAPPTR